MEIFYIAAFFIFGAIVGSFLNVVVLRHGTGRGLEGRSGCMSCAKKLRWYELVPIFSWSLQSGRCRGCGSKVSAQYPLVEFFTGLLFVYGLYILFPALNGLDQLWQINIPSIFELITGAFLLFALATLMAINVYDLKHMIIPDKWSAFFAVSALVFSSVYWFSSPLDLFTTQAGLMHLLAGPILFIPFWFLWFISKGAWIGLGDGKLAIGIGWLLGLTLGLTAIVVSFWIGAVVGVLLLLITRLVNRSGRITMKSEIPFGPFLILGTLLTLFFQMNVLEITNLFI